MELGLLTHLKKHAICTQHIVVVLNLTKENQIQISFLVTHVTNVGQQEMSVLVVMEELALHNQIHQV